MRKIVLGALLIAPLAACTYVQEQPRQDYGYGYRAPPVQQAPTYGYAPAPRDSYEAERQAYEYGRRDGRAGR
jgi:uncharacterized lipoprotein